jgi:serine phosphatase RsbU (regulator of sigma subunit)
VIDAQPARAGVSGALSGLADAARAIAAGEPLQSALDAIVRSAQLATGADLAVIWLDRGAGPSARAVSTASAALAAEIEGLRGEEAAATAELLRGRFDPDAAALSIPLEAGGLELGSLDLIRRAPGFGPSTERVAALAADLAALAASLCPDGSGEPASDRSLLEVVGDALSAASDEERAAGRVARIAALATGADSALVWRPGPDGLAPAGAHGTLEPTAVLAGAAEGVMRDHGAEERVVTEAGDVVTLQLGQPALGILQLRYPTGGVPDDLGPLAGFAVRAAHALRAADRSRDLRGELEQSQALLSVVSEAISSLSLSHTLETALEHVATLLGADRAAVYLETGDRLATAAVRGLSGSHEAVAESLLALTLGPLRGQGLAESDDVTADARFTASVRSDAAAAEIGPALALPLLVQDVPIGLLAVYPRRLRELSSNERALLVALAAQLAVAIQNARLHADVTTARDEREVALEAEREAKKRLQALYDVSRSFAQSLSLETTLDELARSMVTLLGVDAAVIRMPDERGVDFTARAVHVNDERVDQAARALLSRPQPLPRRELQRLLSRREPLLVDARGAAELGGSLAFLAPFLEKGASVAVVPIATAGELLATLTIVSLHPGRPVAGAVADTALSIAGQAALAIDNARLYGQQKAFADTMQRSLLPREVPALAGLEIGDVYESAARVEVGGDVYDYLTLGDGRLAVVLGDVTGHGVDATADMAMAKFVFRSLAREHADPGEFLAAANEVVASEIAPGKFITMVELVIDAQAGTLACASAGHPAPRLVLPDGTVEPVAARGLALGIDAPQVYATVSVPFRPGASVVLYTDGVVEARRGGEQYGVDRLDVLLAERRGLPAKEIALQALAACRDWTEGELADDFAVVVIKRAP